MLSGHLHLHRFALTVLLRHLVYVPLLALVKRLLVPALVRHARPSRQQPSLSGPQGYS
jgi:hypothetical protein